MDEYISRLNKLNEQKLKLEKLSGAMSLARLTVLILGAVISFFIFKKDFSINTYIILIFFALLFIFTVAWHSSIKKDLKRKCAAIIINQNYLDRMGEEWINFKDNGQDFVSTDHRYSSDLDIFGPKSLFQWLNVSYTFHGRKKLREFLEEPLKNIDSIRRRQGAVREMAGKLDFSQELQCEGMLSDGIDNDPAELITYAEDPSKVFKRDWIINLFYILPFVSIFSLALYILGFPLSPYIPFTFFTVQLIFMVYGYIKVLPVLNTVYKFKSNIEAYKNIFKLVEKEDFKDELLSELKSDLFVKGKSASSRLNSLGRIVDAIDLRYNPIIYFILNVTLLWDFHCVFALEEWKKNNGKSISKWIYNIGYLEGISSLSVTLQTDTVWNFPNLSREGIRFSASKLGHPLILKSKRVNNNIDINKNLCIVTGSNMSGKTTLLRTIGINLVLAYAGAPVCSENLECTVMDIFTSMRVADDLSSGISTFYAELLRIKMIIEYSKKEAPMIFLIDELFRGTNSKDRVIGARSLIRNLNRRWVIGLISTHDFELCDLEHENNTTVVNYHFSESYSNNRIRFDYRLRPGRCDTTNAKYLMRMVGIELVEGE